MPSKKESRTRCPPTAEVSLREPLLLAEDCDEYCGDQRADTPTDGHGDNGHRDDTVTSPNVRLILSQTFFAWAGRSIWNSNVLSTYLYLLRDGNAEIVGYTTAVMGISQIIASLPTAVLADRYRRDTMLKISSLCGVFAIVTSLFALHTHSYKLLLVGLAAWGITWGITNTSDTALFADSISDGQRSYYFTQRAILLRLGNVAGPIVSLVMFHFLGDTWTVEDCTIVMSIGQMICLPAFLMYCFLSDDHAVQANQEGQGNLLDYQQWDEENDGRECGDSDGETQAITTDDDDSSEDNSDNDSSSLGTWLAKERYVPTLVATADVISGIASGMSIGYFPIFFSDNLSLSPVMVQMLYVVCPLLQAILMKVSQWLAEYYGRCHVTVFFKWIGISMMVSMILSYSHSWPVWITCTIFVLRTAFMNATFALTKSVIMDSVPKEERAKWSAVESLNMFSWSGSAALGGLLVGYRGLVFNFCVTACLQFVATLPLVALFSCDDNDGTEVDDDSTTNQDRNAEDAEEPRAS